MASHQINLAELLVLVNGTFPDLRSQNSQLSEGLHAEIHHVATMRQCPVRDNNQRRQQDLGVVESACHLPYQYPLRRQRAPLYAAPTRILARPREEAAQNEETMHLSVMPTSPGGPPPDGDPPDDDGDPGPEDLPDHPESPRCSRYGELVR